MAALYYDGRTAVGRPVLLQLVQAGRRAELRITGEGIDIPVDVDGRALRRRVRTAQHLIGLPDGASIEVLDVARFDALLQQAGMPGGDGVAGLEGSWRMAAVALLLIGAGTFAFLTYGVPALAKRVAPMIPSDVDAYIGAESLALLDRGLLEPSALPMIRQNQLRRLFGDIALDGDQPGAALEFRRGGRLGPNALALPSGIVVLTDELEAAAQNDDELRGVLAHEVGHLVHRHAMRRLLQSSASALLMVALLGDINSATSLVAGIPVLVDAAYSRDLEREADDFARAWMREHGVPPQRLGELLERVAGDQDRGGFLSTHPGIAERLGTGDTRGNNPGGGS